MRGKEDEYQELANTDILNFKKKKKKLLIASKKKCKYNCNILKKLYYPDKVVEMHTKTMACPSFSYQNHKHFRP